MMNSTLRLFSDSWAGVFASEFTLERVRQYGQCLGAALSKHNLTCMVAYDTRFMSNLFAHDIYRLLNEQGVQVSLVPSPAPLPAVQLALESQNFDCAVYVSARNLPYWHNGIVLLETGEPLLVHEMNSTTPTDTAEGEHLFPSIADSNTPGQVFTAESTLDVRTPYQKMLTELVDMNLIRRVTLTIFADPMHGTLAGYLPALIGGGNYTKAIEINREVDPLFGKITPLPAPPAISRLSKLVRESDSNIGLAFSADGTSLGVVDKNGEPLQQLEIVLLLASYLSSQYRQKGTVIAPPPAAGTPLANAIAGIGTWENTLGFKVELAPNATERIPAFLSNEQNTLLLGCTTEGELIVYPYSSYPDALLAGLLIVEMVARSGGSLRTSLDNLRSLLAVRE
jgi:phosphomannomutase